MPELNSDSVQHATLSGAAITKKGDLHIVVTLDGAQENNEFVERRRVETESKAIQLDVVGTSIQAANAAGKVCLGKLDGLAPLGVRNERDFPPDAGTEAEPEDIIYMTSTFAFDDGHMYIREHSGPDGRESYLTLSSD